MVKALSNLGRLAVESVKILVVLALGASFVSMNLTYLGVLGRTVLGNGDITDEILYPPSVAKALQFVDTAANLAGELIILLVKTMVGNVLPPELKEAMNAAVAPIGYLTVMTIALLIFWTVPELRGCIWVVIVAAWLFVTVQVALLGTGLSPGPSGQGRGGLLICTLPLGGALSPKELTSHLGEAVITRGV